MEPNKDDITPGMEPLFKEAREKGLWFYSQYQGLWFSPDQLEELLVHQKRFRWGPVNWMLRDPQEAIDELKRQVCALENQISDFEKLILLSKQPGEIV